VVQYSSLNATIFSSLLQEMLEKLRVPKIILSLHDQFSVTFIKKVILCHFIILTGTG
jgi:hypothetical protein